MRRFTNTGKRIEHKLLKESGFLPVGVKVKDGTVGTETKDIKSMLDYSVRSQFK